LRIYLAILIVVFLVGMLGMIAFEHRSPLDALYFVVVTIATVGFGDIYPETAIGKLLTIGIILVGVGCFVGLAATALDLMIENRERGIRMRNLNMISRCLFFRSRDPAPPVLFGTRSCCRSGSVQSW